MPIFSCRARGDRGALRLPYSFRRIEIESPARAAPEDIATMDAPSRAVDADGGSRPRDTGRLDSGGGGGVSFAHAVRGRPGVSRRGLACDGAARVAAVLRRPELSRAHPALLAPQHRVARAGRADDGARPGA